MWLRKLLAQSINNRRNNEAITSTDANPQASD
jgi:hypothetical protein